MNRKQFLFRLFGLGAIAAIVPKIEAEPEESKSPADGATMVIKMKDDNGKWVTVGEYPYNLMNPK